MIILMGLAGSGKSTQGKILAEELDGVWLSAGQVLRDTDDAEIHAIQERGDLVPDSITIPLVFEAIQKIKESEKPIILDGFPRNTAQAKWMADNLATEIEAVIWIEVPKDELIERIKARGRADDQTIEAVRERFRLVEQNICSICAILQEKKVKITKISGLGTVEEVSDRLKELVKKLKKHQPVAEFDAGCPKLELKEERT